MIIYLKEILFTEKSLEEFQNLEKDVQFEFQTLFRSLKEEHQLPRKYFKKLTSTEFYEFRIRTNRSIYRVICAVIKPNLVILLIFKKKTQKMPKRLLGLAKKRLNQLL
jgi:phage-related protein